MGRGKTRTEALRLLGPPGLAVAAPECIAVACCTVQWLTRQLGLAGLVRGKARGAADALLGEAIPPPLYRVRVRSATLVSDHRIRPP
jgi:hypothetical protein